MQKMLWELQAPLAIAKAKEDLGVDNIWRYLRYYKMYMARFKWVVGDKDYTNAIENILFCVFIISSISTILFAIFQI